jgi:hypothetical protein
MRKLLVLLLCLAALPLLVLSLLIGTVRYSYSVAPEPMVVHPSADGGPGVPMPPGYPSPAAMPYHPSPAATWAKGASILVLGTLLLGGAALVGLLVAKSGKSAGRADRELDGGIEQLLANLERMDSRIGNLETILIERRR